MKLCRNFLLILFASSALFGNVRNEKQIPSTPWVAYYGKKAAVSKFYNYDPIVFLPQHHPILAPLLVKGKTLLAYISLGDKAMGDELHKEMLKQKFFIKTHPYDSHRSIIDVRNPQWQELVVNVILPEAIAEGFNGFCFANLDLLLNLELEDSEKYKGMTEAVISLLAAIKKHYGNYKIMVDMHGLLHIGERILPYVDLLLYESLLTQKNCKQALTSPQNYLLCARALKELQAKKPSLPVYTLDFWSAKEGNTTKMIYAEQRRHGFIPYVTDDVNQFTLEPK